MGHQHGQGRAHEKRGNKNKPQGDGGDHRQWRPRGHGADLLEDRQGEDAEESGQRLDHGEQGNGPARQASRQGAARQAPQAQPHHEGGDDDGHGLDVHAQDAEQGPLPDELVDQRRKAGKEKEDAQNAGRG